MSSAVRLLLLSGFLPATPIQIERALEKLSGFAIKSEHIPQQNLSEYEQPIRVHRRKVITRQKCAPRSAERYGVENHKAEHTSHTKDHSKSG